MAQSKKGSLAEVVIGTFIGFVVSLASQRIIFPMYGMTPTWSVDIQIVLWFTVVSIIRGYVLRRVFERISRNADVA